MVFYEPDEPPLNYKPLKTRYFSRVVVWNEPYGLEMAEREGFEPPGLLHPTVFKTAAIDRSAISPGQKYIFFVDPSYLGFSNVIS